MTLPLQHVKLALSASGGVRLGKANPPCFEVVKSRLESYRHLHRLHHQTAVVIQQPRGSGSGAGDPTNPAGNAHPRGGGQQSNPSFNTSNDTSRASYCGSTGTVGQVQEISTKAIATCELQELQQFKYAANARSLEGKRSKSKGKSKRKGPPRLITPRPSQAQSSRSDRPQPKAKPEAHSCATNDFLFAMMSTKSKPTWRHSNWNGTDYMICTVVGCFFAPPSCR